MIIYNGHQTLIMDQFVPAKIIISDKDFQTQDN